MLRTPLSCNAPSRKDSGSSCNFIHVSCCRGKCNEKGYALESIDTRKIALKQWLIQCGLPLSLELKPMINDASFRRYFRVYTPTGTWVAMDAPPPWENCESYVAIARALLTLGLQVPEIIYEDIVQGFLLITDLGEVTYLRALTMHNADQLYDRALKALCLMQGLSHIPSRTVPLFDKELMWKEWEWHKEWFLGKLLGLSLSVIQEKELDSTMMLLVESAMTQPQVFMHRDFHSANLMVLANENVGVLDFQDAFRGPITYDLASLLRDCYIDWPHERVTAWAIQYWQQLQALGVLTKKVSYQEFLRWFDWMGMQRHIKTLFTFARKHLRDQQSHYLKHVPRTLKYLLTISQCYSQCRPLHDYLETKVQPAFDQMKSLCVG